MAPHWALPPDVTPVVLPQPEKPGSGGQNPVEVELAIVVPTVVEADVAVCWDELDVVVPTVVTPGAPPAPPPPSGPSPPMTSVLHAVTAKVKSADAPIKLGAAFVRFFMLGSALWVAAEQPGGSFDHRHR